MGEKICPICCGREREVTIDCPSDCPHLIAGTSLRSRAPQAALRDEFPYRDIEFPADFVYELWPVVTAIASAILGSQLQNKDLNDSSALCGARKPGGNISHTRHRNLLRAAAGFTGGARPLWPTRRVPSELPQAGSRAHRLPSALKESDVFRLLVFLLRICKQETNGRPRSRAFLDFLRARFPLPRRAAKETSRIIMP